MRTWNWPLVVCAGLAFSFGGTASGASAADRIGETLEVVNLVTAQLSRDTRTLARGDAVHQHELIEVGTDGSSEFKFNDETKLALGPGARLVLDKFVYDGSRTAASIALDLAKGAFRFVTGVAAKSSYVIRIPVASITVRGTIFDAYVHETGESWLLLQEGAIQVCNAHGKCRLHDQPGKLLRVTADGDVGSPMQWASMPGSKTMSFDAAFPFVGSPPKIDPNPIFTREAILTGQPPSRRTERTGDAEMIPTSAEASPADVPTPTRTRRTPPDAASAAVIAATLEAADELIDRDDYERDCDDDDTEEDDEVNDRRPLRTLGRHVRSYMDLDDFD